MSGPAPSPLWRTTLGSLAIGGAGAVIAWALNLPAALLIGPALLVSLASLSGIRTAIAEPVRDACFVVLGLGIGAGFDTQASAAILRWPLAFLALGGMLVISLLAGRAMLQRGFGFDRRSAVLAAAPGHLSFVIGLAADTGADLSRIAVVQTIRLLVLTLTVPFIALALGYRMSAAVLPAGSPMPLPALAGLAVVGLGAGLILKRARVPAPLLLGPMIVSAAAHATDLVPGDVPAWLMLPAFIGLGTLIGTRFAGMTWTRFRASVLAGLSVTIVTVVLAALAAIPVSMALAMPTAHILAAFAPGGLETMVALGATMAASPGFIAACHVMRLVILSVLIPLFLGNGRTG